jgi:hypothetical protein
MVKAESGLSDREKTEGGAVPSVEDRGKLEVECLLTEYKANVDLWKHDDDLRQKRTTTFITLNVLLYGIASFTIEKSQVIGSWTVNATVGTAILGLLTCVVWIIVHVRNARYIRFRRDQLVFIEKKLGGVIDTFTRQRDAVSRGRVLGKLSSTNVEYMLPLALVALWIAVVAFVLLRTGQPPNPPPQTRPSAAVFGTMSSSIPPVRALTSNTRP